VKILTTEQAATFLQGMGLDVTRSWVEKMAEPDAGGRRKLPFFKLTDGKTAKLYTTDEALEDLFRQHAGKALEGVLGEGFLTNLLQGELRHTSSGEGKQGVKRGTARSARG